MSLSVEFNPFFFDPGINEVIVSFFASAGKYAFFYGILGVLIKMLVKAASGKENFL